MVIFLEEGSGDWTLQPRGGITRITTSVTRGRTYKQIIQPSERVESSKSIYVALSLIKNENINNKNYSMFVYTECMHNGFSSRN